MSDIAELDLSIALADQLPLKRDAPFHCRAKVDAGGGPARRVAMFTS